MLFTIVIILIEIYNLKIKINPNLNLNMLSNHLLKINLIAKSILKHTITTNKIFNLNINQFLKILILKPLLSLNILQNLKQTVKNVNKSHYLF
jgi:hypothetical protein